MTSVFIMQQYIVEFAKSSGEFPADSDFTSEEKANRLLAGLLAIEMTVIGLVMRFVYSSEEYGGAGMRRKSLEDALDPKDGRKASVLLPS